MNNLSSVSPGKIIFLAIIIYLVFNNGEEKKMSRKSENKEFEKMSKWFFGEIVIPLLKILFWGSIIKDEEDTGLKSGSIAYIKENFKSKKTWIAFSTSIVISFLLSFYFNRKLLDFLISIKASGARFLMSFISFIFVYPVIFLLPFVVLSIMQGLNNKKKLERLEEDIEEQMYYMDLFESIGFKDRQGNTPYFLEYGEIDKDRQVYLFKSKIDLDTWKKALNKIETVLDTNILKIDYGKSKQIIILETSKEGLKPDRMEITELEEIEKDEEIKHSIKINDNIVWNFREAPHALINGGTGGGKTFLLIYLIRCLLGMGAKLKILDPKRSVLYSLRYYLGKINVAAKHEEIAEILINTVDEMEKRFDEIEKKRMKDKKVTNDYADYGFKPVFLIFDELMAFMRGGIEQKTKKQAEKALLDLIAMGREAGFFVIISMQRGSTKSIDGDVRDQLHFRATLGKMEADGYRMAFGDGYNNLKKTLNEKGTGFIQIDGDEKLGEPQEFYSPFISKEYNFFDEVEKLAKELYPELHKKKQEKEAKQAKEKREKEKKLVELEEKKQKAVKPKVIDK